MEGVAAVRSLRIVSAGVLIALTAGCGGKVVYRDRIKTVQVPVRAPCPDPETYGEIKNARPVPLRSQPKPATAEERVAKTAAQLGRYEAEGGWADQATAALDRCQLGIEIVD